MPYRFTYGAGTPIVELSRYFRRAQVQAQRRGVNATSGYSPCEGYGLSICERRGGYRWVMMSLNVDGEDLTRASRFLA
jgi:hypothetical protein